MKKPSKLRDAILAHLKNISFEEGTALYGVAESTLRTVLRTKKPSGSMMEIYLDKFGMPQNGPLPEPAPSTRSAEPETTDLVSPLDDLLNHPLMKAIIQKINELVKTNGEVIATIDNHSQRVGQVETTLSQIMNRVAGPQPQTTPAPARVPLGVPPPGDDYAEPEVISAVRPNRATVPVVQEFRDVFAQTHVPAPLPPATPDFGSIINGTAFDYLSPHKQK